MQLIGRGGHVLSIWTPEQFLLVKKVTERFTYRNPLSPFEVESGEAVSHMKCTFVNFLRDANNGFALMLQDHRKSYAEKVEIYQAGLLVMILLDKLDRSEEAASDVLVWAFSELPRHATC